MEIKNNNLLFLKNIYKSYGSKVILDDIDLSISGKEFCTVVGPSGSGKSTLLRLILGQELPTSGSINFHGNPIGFSDKRRGVVYQKYSLYSHLSVIENVMLGKKLELGFFKSRSKLREIKDESLEFLNRMRLADDADKYPNELSGGMKQRVAIAQALIMRPKILLMDEPFGALDPGTRESMQLFILEIWEKADMTIFFITHDLEEAIFLGTRILVLSQYFTDSRGEDKNRGSRIVADYQLKDKAHSTMYKNSSDFRELLSNIRKDGFSPKYIQHASDFNLKHPDSYQTLAEEERKN
jgi:NitT/TauT family transport system ATP-binding protein